MGRNRDGQAQQGVHRTVAAGGNNSAVCGWSHHWGSRSMAQPRAGRAQVGAERGELGLVRNVSGKGCSNEARAAGTELPARGNLETPLPVPGAVTAEREGRQAGRKEGRQAAPALSPPSVRAHRTEARSPREMAVP